MRSFAVIAGFAAAANAYAYGYAAPSGSAPCTEEYAPTPVYPVYNKPYQTTEVVYGLTTYCPEATTFECGGNYYTATCETTITDDSCTYTTTYLVTPTPAPVKPTNYATSAYPVAPTKAMPSYPAQFTGAAGKAGVAMGAIAGALAAFL